MTWKPDLEQANKDNNSNLVPDFTTLEPLEKLMLAKSVQFTSPAANFHDLFRDLVPPAVSEAVCAYSSKKDTLVTAEVEKLREATRALNE